MSKTAIIVGDFQWSNTTEYFCREIERLRKTFDKVVVIVRTGALPRTSHFPLSFEEVRTSNVLGNLKIPIIPLIEREYNQEFSNKLDEVIDNISDHFTKYTIFNLIPGFTYYGNHELGKGFESKPLSEPSKRYYQGIIDGLRTGFGSTHAVIDIGLVLDGNLIYGTKKKHNGLFCLPGGFVDPILDDSAEEACARELLEETGYLIQNHKFKYLRSMKGTDSRFIRDKNKMMTFVYTCFVNTKQDQIKRSVDKKDFDDLDSVLSTKIEAINPNSFIKPHREIVKQIIRAYEYNKKKL